MPLRDLLSNPLTEQERMALQAAINSVDGILRPRGVNLTPEERQSYGSVAERMKGFVNKVADYHRTHP